MHQVVSVFRFDVILYARGSRRLGYNNVREDPLIVSLAEKYNVTPTQIVFSWHLKRNTVIVPKSENSDRQKENITVSQIEPWILSFC